MREAIRAFDREGLDSHQPKTRARHDDQQALDAAGREWLQAVVRRSPREFGFEGSLWTLDWLAELAAREGYVPKELDRTPMWEGGPAGPPPIKTVIHRVVEEWGTRLTMLEAGDVAEAGVSLADAAQAMPWSANYATGRPLNVR